MDVTPNIALSHALLAWVNSGVTLDAEERQAVIVLAQRLVRDAEREEAE